VGNLETDMTAARYDPLHQMTAFCAAAAALICSFLVPEAASKHGQHGKETDITAAHCEPGQ
jgi:hypothetical protein